MVDKGRWANKMEMTGGKKIREFKNKGWIKSRGTTNKEKKEIEKNNKQIKLNTAKSLSLSGTGSQQNKVC